MDRPLGIILLGALLIFAGVALIIIVLGWTYGWLLYEQLAPPGSPLARAFDSLTIAFAALLIAAATIVMLAGVGIYEGRDWAWPLAFALAATEGGVGVAVAIFGPNRLFGVGTLALAGAIVFYLTRRGTKVWFGRT